MFLLGDAAVRSYYSSRSDVKFFTELPLASCRGKVIPDLEYGCWVCFSYHPSYIEGRNEDLEHIFELDFETFIKTLDRKKPAIDVHENDVTILNEKDANYFLKHLKLIKQYL